jgi:DNA-binding transcriptional LysR family regulator
METMHLSTDMLAAFVMVADTLSVSAAARDLGVGKSVVSKRIAQLEASVKATLFSRSTRRVALTLAGEAYLDCARRALDEMSSGEERLRGLRSEPTGKIRLTAPVSWGQHVLAKHLPLFLQQNPAIDIELLLSDRMMDLAYERIDIGLRWSTLLAPELSAEVVAEVAWVIAAAPGYLRQAGVPKQPQDLAQHPCMSYWTASADDVWNMRQGEKNELVRVGSRYHVNNPEAVAEAALAGLGVALLPRYLCEQAIAQRRLRVLLKAWTPQTKFGAHITAVAAPERMRFVRNQVLLTFLRAQLGAREPIATVPP